MVQWSSFPQTCVVTSLVAQHQFAEAIMPIGVPVTLSLHKEHFVKQAAARWWLDKYTLALLSVLLLRRFLPLQAPVEAAPETDYTGFTDVSSSLQPACQQTPEPAENSVHCPMYVVCDLAHSCDASQNATPAVSD